MITKTKVEEMNDYTIEIAHDDYADCPLEYSNGLRAYAKGRNIFQGSLSLEHDLTTQIDDYAKLSDYMNAVGEEMNSYMFPLAKYEHSAVSYYIGLPTCPRDSGIIGIVTVDKNEWMTLECAEDYANAVMNELTEWANGECYYFTTINNETGEEVDSCGGYIGYENVKESALENIPEGKDYNVIKKD